MRYLAIISQPLFLSKSFHLLNRFRVLPFALAFFYDERWRLVPLLRTRSTNSLPSGHSTVVSIRSGFLISVRFTVIRFSF